MSSVADAGPLRIVKDAPCTACGCLCDDIILSAHEDRIVSAENACETGRLWFLADRASADVEETRIEGQPALRDEALARAAHLLASARSPLIIGLTQCASETTATALALADRIGAIVDADCAGAAADRLRAIQRIGRVSATLGEVKNRADLVVFWGVDPVTTHPRHFERYSVEPPGRFVSQGRTVLVLDAQRTATAERADLFVPVSTDARFATLWTLRALVKGVSLDAGRVERSTGVALVILNDLAARLKQARYGAWFFAPAHQGPAGEEAVLALVRDLNADARFVALTLGAPGNASGAEAVTTWQTGIPSRVDLSQGAPRFWPGETRAESLLAKGETDLAIIVADDVHGSLSPQAQSHLARIPRIVIAPRPDRNATVAFASATTGIDAGGSVIRSDGVVLPLRPPLTARLPTDHQWLTMLCDRVNARRTP